MCPVPCISVYTRIEDICPVPCISVYIRIEDNPKHLLLSFYKTSVFKSSHLLIILAVPNPPSPPSLTFLPHPHPIPSSHPLPSPSPLSFPHFSSHPIIIPPHILSTFIPSSPHLPRRALIPSHFAFSIFSFFISIRLLYLPNK